MARRMNHEKVNRQKKAQRESFEYDAKREEYRREEKETTDFLKAHKDDPPPPWRRG